MSSKFGSHGTFTSSAVKFSYTPTTAPFSPANEPSSNFTPRPLWDRLWQGWNIARKVTVSLDLHVKRDIDTAEREDVSKENRRECTYRAKPNAHRERWNCPGEYFIELIGDLLPGKRVKPVKEQNETGKSKNSVALASRGVSGVDGRRTVCWEPQCDFTVSGVETVFLQLPARWFWKKNKKGISTSARSVGNRFLCFCTWGLSQNWLRFRNTLAATTTFIRVSLTIKFTLVSPEPVRIYGWLVLQEPRELVSGVTYSLCFKPAFVSLSLNVTVSEEPFPKLTSFFRSLDSDGVGTAMVPQ
ncbi:hypothetical protein BaRGS_00017179, partial [Batillaria attramentaria]